MPHEHSFSYSVENHKTGNFDVNLDGLYFLEMECKCGEKCYEQYHFEDTISEKQLNELRS